MNDTEHEHQCGDPEDCRLCRWLPRPGEQLCEAPYGAGYARPITGSFCRLARGHAWDVWHRGRTVDGALVCWAPGPAVAPPGPQPLGVGSRVADKQAPAFRGEIRTLSEPVQGSPQNAYVYWDNGQRGWHEVANLVEENAPVRDGIPLSVLVQFQKDLEGVTDTRIPPWLVDGAKTVAEMLRVRLIREQPWYR